MTLFPRGRFLSQFFVCCFLAVFFLESCAPGGSGVALVSRDEENPATKPEGSSPGSSPSSKSPTPNDAIVPPAALDCNEANKVIYLLSSGDLTGGRNELFSFDPRKDGLSAYRKIGDVDCPTSKHPQSLAIDRRGVAWIFFTGGELFNVDLTNARCTPTGYTLPGNGSSPIGMAYTAVEGDREKETLFVLQTSLFILDLKAFTVSRFGTSGYYGDITGGGDGRLFIFKPHGSGSLIEVDPVTSAELGMHVFHDFPIQQTISFWATARHDGNFYFFTASPSQKTQTTVFDPITKKITLRDADIGVRIVGAGQSICVPAPNEHVPLN